MVQILICRNIETRQLLLIRWSTSRILYKYNHRDNKLGHSNVILKRSRRLGKYFGCFSELNLRYNDPPPPAPSSARGKPLNGGIDYFSYSRGARNPPPPPPQRNDEYATYGRSGPSDTYADLRKVCFFDSSLCLIQREPLKLNFYSTGQILSEARERDNISLASGSTMTLDIPAPGTLSFSNLSFILKLLSPLIVQSSVYKMHVLHQLA